MGIHARFFAPPRQDPGIGHTRRGYPHRPRTRVSRVFLKEIRRSSGVDLSDRRLSRPGEIPLYAVDPKILYGISASGTWWRTRAARAGPLQPQIERKVAEPRRGEVAVLRSYYPEDEFWRLYDKSAYDVLKHRYDPAGLQESVRKMRPQRVK